MNEALRWGLVFVPVAVVLWLIFGQPWWLRRKLREIASGSIGDRAAARLLPESLYIVEMTPTHVSCRDPDGTVETVSWDDLQRVEIVTNDHGPWLMDRFWVLHGSETGCVVPTGATGETALLERLQTLPNFDSEALVESVSLTSNNRFLCWERKRE